MPRFSPPQHRRLLLVGIVCAVMVAACIDEDPIRVEAEPTESSAALILSDLRTDRGTIDDQWAALSQTEVPGFAGLWYDSETGEIVVAAADPESRDAARAWAGQSRVTEEFPEAAVRFEVVDYDFMQLRTWKAAAREILRRADVVYLDADEARNRLVLGVTQSADESHIRERADRLGIPTAAVELVVTTRSGFNGGAVTAAGHSDMSSTAQSSTLTDRVRPTIAGLEIQSSAGECTLGFNALVAGDGDDPHFVTASHCSSDPFDPDTGIFDQDAGSSGTQVGRESHDLEPQTGVLYFNSQAYNCTSGPCRFSDASLVAYDDSIDAGDVGLGKVAFTNENSTTILYNPQSVTAKRDISTLFVGLKVEMVGRTSGRTKGEITNTCVDWEADEFVTVELLCQYRGDYDADERDSGAPVYARRPNGTLALIGVHSASPAGTNLSQFSTIAGIEADLSVTLDVCIPSGCTATAPALDVEIDGPDEVLEFTNCVYTADATGGFPPYSYQWFVDEDSVEVGGDEQEFEFEGIGEDDFMLEVRVTDAMNAGKLDDIYVDVSPTHPNCELAP